MTLDISELRSVIADAWNSQYSVDELNRLLQRFEQTLCNPLVQSPPNPDDRKSVQSGTVSFDNVPHPIPLEEHVISSALGFSDAVHLNELEATKYILNAYRMSPDDVQGKSAEETAMNVYFNQRRDILVTLLDIVQMVDSSQTFDPRLVRITQSYAQRLRDKGIIGNIIKRIRELSGSKVTKIQYLIDTEIEQLALILFYIQQNIGLDPPKSASATGSCSNLLAVVNLAEYLSKLVPSSLPDEHKALLAHHFESLITTVYLLLASLMLHMTEPAQSDDVSAVTGFHAWEEASGVVSCMSSTYALLHALITSSGSAASSADVSRDDFLKLCAQGLQGIYRFLESLPTLPPQPKRDLAEVVCSVMIRLMSEHMEVLRLAPSDPAQLLSMLGAVLEKLCSISPGLATNLWRSASFVSFLSALDQLTPLTSSRFTGYISLLCSLCTPETTQRTFNFVGAAKLTNWHRIFDILQRSMHDSLPPMHSKLQGARGLSPKIVNVSTALPALDIRILCDLLRLLAAVSRAGPSGNSIALQHFSVLDTLFHMLSCSFPLRLKAAIFTCIDAWLQGRASEAPLVWERLEQSRVVPATSGGSSALLRDLDDIEARDGEYPLTLTFLSLLTTLLRHSPLPVLLRLGEPARPGGLEPYMWMVCERVLIVGVQRRYQKLEKKFEFLGSAVSVLIALVEVDESPEAHPAAASVLEALIQRQSSLLKALLHIIREATEALTFSRTQLLSEQARLTLRVSVQLLVLGCRWEETMRSRLWARSEASTELSALLLRQPRAVGDICAAIADPADALLRKASARLLLALALRDSTLVVRLLSSVGQLDRLRCDVADQLRSIHATSPAELKAQTTTAETLLSVLVETVRQPWPSLAHVLLGFSPTLASSATSLAASLSHLRSGSLQALLQLVRKPRFMRVFPSLAQQCLRLLFRLLEDPRTARPLFAHLSLRDDTFFSSCLHALPLLQPRDAVDAGDDVGAENDGASRDACYLLQLAWLLKSLALDLHMRRDMPVLEDAGPSALDILGLRYPHNEHEQEQENAVLSTVNGTDTTAAAQTVLNMLPALRPRLSTSLPPFGGLERESCVQIGKEALLNCIERCGSESDGGREGALCSERASRAGAEEFLWHIERLHAAAHAAGLDADAVARSAAAFNDNIKLLAASRTAVDGWTQLVQVWLYEREPAELDLHVEMQLLLAVLAKLQDAGWRAVTQALSSLALSLMTHLRDNASLLPASVANGKAEQQQIVQRCLDAIMSLDAHVARSHLYGVFYAYIQFQRELDDTDAANADANTETAPRGWGLSQALQELNLSSAQLLRRVCDDAFDGVSSSRALALLFLAAFPLEQVLPILERQSMILRFVQALHTHKLGSALTDTPNNYGQILALESQLLLLLHLAQSRVGARALFACEVLERLLDGFMDARPSFSQPRNGHPSALEKYHQLLCPALEIIVSLLVAMPHRHDLHRRVLDLLLLSVNGGHRRTFLETLRASDNALAAPLFLLRALLASASILQLLSRGPLQDESELGTAVAILLARLPELAFTFRAQRTQTRLDDEHERRERQRRRELQMLVFREVLALALGLTQRQAYTFSASLDPRLDRDDTVPALAVDQPVPLAVIVYYALRGGVELLKSSAEERSRLEECLASIARHRSAQRVPLDLLPTLAAMSAANLSETQHVRLARKELLHVLEAAESRHANALAIVQRSMQIVFLSLQAYFCGHGNEADVLRRHCDRLKDALDYVEAAFSGKEHNELVAKQVRHCRYELDTFEPQLAKQDEVQQPRPQDLSMVSFGREEQQQPQKLLQLQY